MTGEIETLFELQPRAAQKLTEMLPSLKVGTSRLIEREVLVRFLDLVQDADSVAMLFDQLRAEKTLASRRKIRSLVRRDLEPVSLTSLPDAIQLSRGPADDRLHHVPDYSRVLELISY